MKVLSDWKQSCVQTYASQVRFQLLTAVSVNIMVFWDVALLSVLQSVQQFYKTTQRNISETIIFVLVNIMVGLNERY
jgi:hypothetical protein